MDREKGLERLRDVIDRVRSGDGRGVPAADVIAARDALGASALTIDLDAAEQLGQPMVVPARTGDPEGKRVDPGGRRRMQKKAEPVAAGLRNRDIALALEISLGTVKDHVHRILRKSGLDGRAHVASVWRG